MAAEEDVAIADVDCSTEWLVERARQSLKENNPYEAKALLGCVFHWTQALWRKVQELGLQVWYREDRGTHAFIRKVMALLFLAEADIRQHFERLQQTANTATLLEFMNFVSSTRIEGNTWPPSCWSVYMQSVRANNDVEGWHHGLPTRAQGKSQLPMSLLTKKLLYKEARLTSLSVRMVSEKELRRVQRRRYRQIQARVFSLWSQYENGDKTPRQLPKACSLIVGSRGRVNFH